MNNTNGLNRQYQNNNTAAEPPVPENYKPLGAWAYFGYNLLFSLPLIGIIFAIVFACGGTKNINLRNYSRSFFCALLVAAILFVVVFVISLISGVSLAGLAGMMESAGVA